MKITRHSATPVVTTPDTFTLELTLDEAIFLKTVCNCFVALAATSSILADNATAAKRFTANIKEADWSWKDTDSLFK